MSYETRSCSFERMRQSLLLLIGLGSLMLTGCKKQVPTDIVQKSLRSALRIHAPATTSAMCGLQVKGLVNANITNVVRNKDGKSGTAHVSGAPWLVAGAPASCEGDVEFQYTYTQRTSGSSKKRSTTTTWYLDKIKLVAVQTKGVTLKPVEENSNDEDDTP